MPKFVYSFGDFEVCMKFKIQSSDDEDCSNVEYDKDIETLADSMKPGCVTGVECPFIQLKERMSPITDDGLILKEVMKQGIGLPITENSIVYFHYDAFKEGQKDAFDSTRSRGKPFKFQLGDGQLCPGLEIGIRTMKEAEISRIMVSPDYAFEEIGCPPQISPNAEILYEVQILKSLPKDVVEFEEMSFEDREKVPFEKIISIYQCYNQLANDLFRKKMFKQAIARYRHAVILLEEVSVTNEEEENKRKECLLKLYLNLAQCFLDIEKPQKGVVYAELALEIDSNNPKGLYRMGKALYLTGRYKRALQYLSEAKKHKPFEKYINRLIKELSEKSRSHLDWEKSFCKLMIRSKDLGLDQKQEAPLQEYDISKLGVFKNRCPRTKVCDSFVLGTKYCLF